VKFQGGRTKKVYLSLKFAGRVRELGLNATNRKVLAMLAGSTNTASWFGMTVALFVEQNVRYPDGTSGPAVRIRAKRIEQSKAPAGAPPEGAVEGFDPSQDKDLT
jgi:hypothetical protein